MRLLILLSLLFLASPALAYESTLSLQLGSSYSDNPSGTGQGAGALSGIWTFDLNLDWTDDEGLGWEFDLEADSEHYLVRTTPGNTSFTGGPQWTFWSTDDWESSIAYAYAKNLKYTLTTSSGKLGSPSSPKRGPGSTLTSDPYEAHQGELTVTRTLSDSIALTGTITYESRAYTDATRKDQLWDVLLSGSLGLGSWSLGAGLGANSTVSSIKSFSSSAPSGYLSTAYASSEALTLSSSLSYDASAYQLADRTDRDWTITLGLEQKIFSGLSFALLGSRKWTDSTDPSYSTTTNEAQATLKIEL